MFRGHVPMEISKRVEIGVDSLNDPIYGLKSFRFMGEMMPLDSTENLDRADQVYSAFTAYLPARFPEGAGVPVASDTITVDGVAYQLRGEPKPCRIHGRLDHYEAVAYRVTG